MAELAAIASIAPAISLILKAIVGLISGGKAAVDQWKQGKQNRKRIYRLFNNADDARQDASDIHFVTTARLQNAINMLHEFSSPFAFWQLR